MLGEPRRPLRRLHRGQSQPLRFRSVLTGCQRCSAKTGDVYRLPTHRNGRYPPCGAPELGAPAQCPAATQSCRSLSGPPPSQPGAPPQGPPPLGICVPTQLVNVQAGPPPRPAAAGSRPQQGSSSPFNNLGRPKTGQGRPRQPQQQQPQGQPWRGGPVGPQQAPPPPPPQQQAPPDCARVSCPVNTMCVGDPRTAGYTVMCASPQEACGGPSNVLCRETKICVNDPRVNW
jgi:hypothetical protein